ncbi:hypothetical protein CBR_g4390 [Chara braunii]|uniref:Uncharacterized protein n=1 Tax=Chara braunii TaxID=69332 RepID=A0A388KHQ4_CHABU|nr:hypothetical protein CBR_g4390 [Chara braunii]|eukprot:GBG69556.1 hypothetical protein CBR_g4390 [Chara braunii]
MLTELCCATLMLLSTVSDPKVDEELVPIVNVLRSDWLEKNSKVVLYAVAAMWCLARDETNRRALGRLGALQVLVELGGKVLQKLVTAQQEDERILSIMVI